jgi:CAAX protease family protein
LYSEENQERYGVRSNSVNLDSPHAQLARARQKCFHASVHWDFALILLVLATVVPLLGRRRIRRLMEAPSTTKTDRLVLYASTIAFQWIAVAVILWRTHAHNLSLASLGLAVPKPVLALATAILLSALILVNQIIALRRLKEHPESSSHGILPHLALKVFPQDTVERLGFTALVSTVAICEELIYRGFAQRVFQDWSARWMGAAIAVGVGVVASAVMFSLAHLYQGSRGLVSTFVVGLLFSIVRALTGSLLPASAAHFVADVTAGFLAPSRLRSGLAKPEAIANSANILHK